MPGAAGRRSAEQLCLAASSAPVRASTGARVISSISGPVEAHISRQSLMLSHSFLVKYTILPTPVCGVRSPRYARNLNEDESVQITYHVTK